MRHRNLPDHQTTNHHRSRHSQTCRRIGPRTERPHFRGYHETAGGGRHPRAGTTGIAELPGKRPLTLGVPEHHALARNRRRYDFNLTCYTPIFLHLNPRSPLNGLLRCRLRSFAHFSWRAILTLGLSRSWLPSPFHSDTGVVARTVKVAVTWCQP